MTRLIRDYCLSAVAALWRRLMRRASFIAVTGSYGKTTATQCLGTILAESGPTNFEPMASNSRAGLAKVILRTRPRHRFTPIEVGTNKPGALWRAAWMIHPDIVVVLAVGDVHSNNFPDLDAIAAEKASLLCRQGRNGIAVLNADDPHVAAMQPLCRGRVLTFGRSPECDLRASEVEATWPSRLSFTVSAGNESCHIETNLVGEHWLSSVLGAIGAAVAVGVSLRQAASSVKKVRPTLGRMQPVEIREGAWLLRDERNTSISTLDAALNVLRDARGVRRIAVLGDVYDSPQGRRERGVDLGRRAARSADMAVFIGKAIRPAKGAAVEAGMARADVRGFRRKVEAADFLRGELRSGDLVLLRGSGTRHFERIYFRLIGTIGCAISNCPIIPLCDYCSELQFRPDSGPQAVVGSNR